jgi:MFS superfamily sulfate permease-like transporter
MATHKRSKTNTFVHDLMASIVVFLVALPLCMGIAIASGMPPATGLISGVVAGIVVGSLSGSPLQVSGPTVGVIMLIVELIERERLEDGSLDMQRAIAALGITVLLAGAMQLAAGAFKLGGWFRAVSPAVVRGMMAGIGVSIVATQFHLMLDDDTRRDGTLSYLASIPQAIWTGVLPLDGSRHHQAAAVGMLTIFMIVLWKEVPWRRLHVLPAALVGVLAAVALSNFLQWPISYINLQGGLGEAVSPMNFAATLPLLRDPAIWIGAATVAITVSVETLLSASAIDQMHTGSRTRYNRELAAQGIGNMVCGLAGALPVAGVIVRSSANVEAGARTRASTILHGFWLLGLASAFPHILELIPRCSLAAVLVYSGYKLVDLKALRELWKLGKGEVAIYCVTVLGIVLEGIALGVLLGVILAALRLLYLFTALHVDLRSDVNKQVATVRLRGAATFLRLPMLAEVLENVPEGAHVRVDLRGLSFTDDACHKLITSWAFHHEQAGGRVTLDWATLEARTRGPAKPQAVAVKESEAA